MFFKCERPHFLVQKTLDFAKFMVCPQSAWKKGEELIQCGNFADKGVGVNFSRFCADVLYGRPLTFHWHSVNHSFFRKDRKYACCFDSIP